MGSKPALSCSNKRNESKLTVSVPEIALTQAIEIIPVAKELILKFVEAQEYTP